MRTSGNIKVGKHNQIGIAIPWNLSRENMKNKEMFYSKADPKRFYLPSVVYLVPKSTEAVLCWFENTTLLLRKTHSRQLVSPITSLRHGGMGRCICEYVMEFSRPASEKVDQGYLCSSGVQGKFLGSREIFLCVCSAPKCGRKSVFGSSVPSTTSCGYQLSGSGPFSPPT